MGRLSTTECTYLPTYPNLSEQGARKSNGFNAAPSCHAESFAAM